MSAPPNSTSAAEYFSAPPNEQTEWSSGKSTILSQRLDDDLHSDFDAGDTTLTDDVLLAEDMTLVGDTSFAGNSSFVPDMSFSGNTTLGWDTSFAGNSSLVEDSPLVLDLSFPGDNSILPDTYIPPDTSNVPDPSMSGGSSFILDQSFISDSSFTVDRSNPAAHHADPAAASLVDVTMSSGTVDDDPTTFVADMACFFPESDGDIPSFDLFGFLVSNLCLLAITLTHLQRRDILLCVVTPANVELAISVFNMASDSNGSLSELAMSNLRELVQMMLFKFRDWWCHWASTPTGNLTAEERACALCNEARLQSPEGWIQVVVLAFGLIPKLWDLGNTSQDPDLDPSDSSVPASSDKGKGVDRSHVPVERSTLQYVEDGDLVTYIDTLSAFNGSSAQGVRSIDAVPGMFESLPNSATGYIALQDVCPPPNADARSAPPIHEASESSPIPQPSPHPSAATGNPAPSGQFPTDAGTSDQRPAPSPQLPSADTRPQTPVEINALDFTGFAEELGATEDLPLPNTRSRKAFNAAAAYLRWDWDKPQEGVPLSSRVTTRSARRRRLDWDSIREHWRRLVQEYKEVKEVQIAKLDEAVCYLRQWHTLFLELEYRLEWQGIPVLPEFRAQAAKIFLIANLITLLIIHRRQQLQRLD